MFFMKVKCQTTNPNQQICWYNFLYIIIQLCLPNPNSNDERSIEQSVTFNQLKKLKSMLISVEGIEINDVNRTGQAALAIVEKIIAMNVRTACNQNPSSFYRTACNLNPLQWGICKYLESHD